MHKVSVCQLCVQTVTYRRADKDKSKCANQAVAQVSSRLGCRHGQEAQRITDKKRLRDAQSNHTNTRWYDSQKFPSQNTDSRLEERRLLAPGSRYSLALVHDKRRHLKQHTFRPSLSKTNCKFL